MPTRTEGFLVLALAATSMTIPSPADAADHVDSRARVDTTGPVLRVNTETFEIHAPPDLRLDHLRTSLEEAVERWRKYFGEAPPRGALVVFPREADVLRSSEASSVLTKTREREDVDFSMPWIMGEGSPLSTRDQALSHEVCHSYLVVYAEHRNPDYHFYDETGGPAYGAEQLPDWLDEAVATLCEPPDLKAERRAHLRARRDDLFPVEEFLAMEHPAQAGARALLRDQRARGDTVIAAQGDVEIPGYTEEKAIFYPQSLATAGYLVRQAGPLVVGRLVRHLSDGGSFRGFLESEADLADSLEGFREGWTASLGG